MTKTKIRVAGLSPGWTISTTPNASSAGLFVFEEERPIVDWESRKRPSVWNRSVEKNVLPFPDVYHPIRPNAPPSAQHGTQVTVTVYGTTEVQTLVGTLVTARPIPDHAAELIARMRNEAASSPDETGESEFRQALRRSLREPETSSQFKLMASFQFLKRLFESTPTTGPGQEDEASTAHLFASEYLPKLVDAGPGMRQRLRTLIKKYVSPLALGEVAFAKFEATANENYLLHARSLLEDFGRDAWPALQWIVLMHPDSELFVGTIIRCPGVASQDRLRILKDLARHGSRWTRESILEHLDELTVGERSAIEDEVSRLQQL